MILYCGCIDNSIDKSTKECNEPGYCV